MHFNGRFVMNLVRFAEQQGADGQLLIDMTGRPAGELCREDCKLDAATYNRVIEAALQATGDEYFGLHAGEHMNLAAAGLIVQIAHTSKTVKQALEYCCEFANLGCSALPLTLTEQADHYQLTLTPEPVWAVQAPLSVQHTVYGYMAFSIREFHSLTRYKHYPRSIGVTFNRPKNVRELERVLGCPVQFNQPYNTLILEKQHVEEQVVSSDYSLLQVLVTHAEEKVAAMQQSGFYEVVKRSVVNMVKPEFPTIEQVAGHLNMSVRTFQRKLKEEGYSYKAVIDELRHEFAISYLRKPELTIGEIAYLLGYADTSAFIRSFKRWTGQTPSAYRRDISVSSSTTFER